MEKFTRGPWRMIHSAKRHNLHVWIIGKDPSENSNRELQVIQMSDYNPINDHHERRLADMRLMTAAPEMYSMLKGVVEGNTPDPAIVEELLNKITPIK